MCKRTSIWDFKTRMRKYLSLKNRNIALIDHVKEKYDISFQEAVDKLLEEPEVREEAFNELKAYYPDYMKEGK